MEASEKFYLFGKAWSDLVVALDHERLSLEHIPAWSSEGEQLSEKENTRTVTGHHSPGILIQKLFSK